jgi:aldose sugar dehydrogenase
MTVSPTFWTRIAWYLPAGALLTLLPVLKYSQLWWQLPRVQKIALLLVTGTFAAACLASLLFEPEQNWRAAARTLVRSLAVFGLGLLGFVALNSEAPLYLVAGLLGSVALVIPLSVTPLAQSRIPAVALGVIALGAIGWAVREVIATRRTSDRITSSAYLRTTFYTVQARSHQRFIPAPATRGGGLDHFGDRVLLGTGDGYLYLVDVPAGDARPTVAKLPTRVPHNRDEFAAAFGGSSTAPGSSGYSEAGPPRVQTWRFRVADVIAKTEGDTVRILASHHWWKPDAQCFVVRVSELVVPAAELTAASIGNAEWHTLYESSPCIPLTGPERRRGKNPFKGEEVGGRLALLDDRTLLLTLGDQGFSGIESVQAFSQNPQAAYGKTIRIDLISHASRLFTLGHRNPQGLYVTREGEIWETEHGAQGGDEVNLLVEGDNYGWPLVTYGTDYGASTWPLSRAQGRHDGFRQPQFAFLPSIGVSQVVRLESDAQFPIWRGNLLVGSLATRSLYRLVADGGRIVLNEPILLGKRVRDILELHDGRILVWTDDAALVTVQLASGDDGASLFAAQCAGCHTIVDGMSHRLGPDLHGIVGRKIAAASGFDEYSAALQALPGEWTQERLDAFLRDPQAMAPGNTMGFVGVPDAKQRKALIDYVVEGRSTEVPGTPH